MKLGDIEVEYEGEGVSAAWSFEPRTGVRNGSDSFVRGLICARAVCAAE